MIFSFRIVFLLILLVQTTYAEVAYSSELCRSLQERYHNHAWILMPPQNHYLTTYLETIDRLNCAQVKMDECSKRYFELNTFTTLVYDHACDRAQLINKCLPTIKDVLPSATNKTWHSLVQQLEDLNKQQLQKPCVQIALYEGILLERGYSFGAFEEVKEFMVPFCAVAWCGVDSKHKEYLSPNLCLSSRCAAGLTVLMFFHGISAVVVGLVNFIILFVIIKTPPLQHVQGIYRTNLALSDFLASVFIFIPAIPITSELIFASHGFGKKDNSMQEFFTAKQIPVANSSTLEHLLARGPTSPLKPWFINMFGFLTYLLWSSSLFTLLSASVDRMCAVCVPQTYSTVVTKRVAIVVCICIWVISVLCSLIPLYSERIFYAIAASSFTGFLGDDTFIYGALSTGIPLVLTWGASCTTLSVLFYRKRSQKGSSNKQMSKTVVRVTKTVALMVGVFTISVAPVQLSLAVGGNTFNFKDLEHFNIGSYNIFKSWLYLCLIIFMYNSFWNFFIYHQRDSSFRKSLLKLFRKNVLRKS